MVKSIILMSGGLDSVVSLGLTRNKYNVELALTFDYGQKAANTEIEASKKICEFYNVSHKVIKLDFLKEITHTSLVADCEVPTGEGLLDEVKSAQNVWVPNRNGLFLNIAASFADGENYDYIIIGANLEEGQTFPDNTKEFIERVNQITTIPLLYSFFIDIETEVYVVNVRYFLYGNKFSYGRRIIKTFGYLPRQAQFLLFPLQITGGKIYTYGNFIVITVSKFFGNVLSQPVNF